ncbi:MAG: SAM-dependent methyltransferase, partial [Bacteroidales bacterium]|nr:SAM-dependent methyltransferase [Bacteroidales bacterium]
MLTDALPGLVEDFLDMEDFDFAELEEELAIVDFQRDFDDFLDNYYKFNTANSMPLLFLALAARNRIRVTQNHTPVEGAYRSFSLQEMKDLNWVKEDAKLRKRISSLLRRGYASVDIEFDLDIQTAAVYSIFVKNDEETVVQEHHHRIGRLIDHRDDLVSYRMHQKYSALRLVRFLINHKSYVSKTFINLYHKVLVKSGLQPERPRLVVANAISALAEYSGNGTVYVPFAGIGIVGAMLGPKAGDRLYVDGDPNPKLLACGRLLNYGMGGNNAHFELRNSLQWISVKPLELVISTYRGFPGGKSAFSFSYEKSMESLSDSGKYIGVIPSSTLFESDQKSHPEILETIKEAVDNDYLDTIIIMPFNETIVLFRKNKPIPGKVRLFDRRNSFVQAISIELMLQDPTCVKVISCREIVKKKYRLKPFVVKEPRQYAGRKIVRASEYIARLK